MKGATVSIRAALAMLALIGAAPVGRDSDPASYALRAPIAITEGSLVQRLALPAAVLAASRAADLADVRVFDASNRAMPIARVTAATGPSRRYDLPALPILGAADALNVTGVSLRLDGSGQARVAQVVGTVRGGAATATLLGVLLDARAAAGEVDSLILDADLPAGQPVTFTIEASTDLTEWRSLAERTIYRSGDPGPAGGATRIPLGNATLAGDYLRITWRATSRLLSPVTIRRGVLLARPAAAAAVSIATVLPPLASSEAAEFALPFATPLTAVRLVPTGGDLIVPARVLGRNHREQPWTLLGEGTAAAGRPNDIRLGGSTYLMLRIEADRRSAGFTSPPAISLIFEPREIVFLAAGRPPFTLAAGLADAADIYLPARSIMADGAGRPGTATAATTTTAVTLERIDDSGNARRQLLLWAALLGATATLGAMAWLLWKRGQAAN